MDGVARIDGDVVDRDQVQTFLDSTNWIARIVVVFALRAVDSPTRIDLGGPEPLSDGKGLAQVGRDLEGRLRGAAGGIQGKARRRLTRHAVEQVE